MKKVTPYFMGAMIGVGLTLGAVAVAKVPSLLHSAGMLQVLLQMDLDRDQWSSFKDFHHDAEAIHDEMRELHEQNFEIVRGELLEEEPDRELIHDLIDDTLATIRGVVHDRADALLDIHATFTPEQRVIFVDGLEGVRAEKIAFMESLKEEMRPADG